MFKVMVSRTFQKQFDHLPKGYKEKVRKGLKELEIDPFEPRPKVDIRTLRDTEPQKYRLRIGEYRIIYSMEKRTVMVLELFIRSRGYQE